MSRISGISSVTVIPVSALSDSHELDYRRRSLLSVHSNRRVVFIYGGTILTELPNVCTLLAVSLSALPLRENVWKMVKACSIGRSLGCSANASPNSRPHYNQSSRWNNTSYFGQADFIAIEDYFDDADDEVEFGLCRI